ncbi:MAG TPA: T9SS type A sorting domain-containing protein [Flavobacteriales bacterium]|nr:T9SS type A sorting domain-containing protein [Flavobacteriales bacterium]
MNPFGPSSPTTGSTVPVGCPLPVFSKALPVAMLCIFSHTLATAQTSVYHPFPDSNAVWGLLSGATFCPDISVQDYYAGDTIIDQHTYKIIAEYVTDPIDCAPHGIGTGFLFDDTAARKVYWRIPGATSDSLLYDFTLEVGDTLRGLYANTGPCADAPVTIISIDSIEVGGSYRRKMNLANDDCFGPSIIEGLGSTTGLTSCYFMNKSFGIVLTCFTVNGELLYEKPCGAPELAPCGNLPLGFSSEHSFAHDIVTPNPSTGLFYIGQASRQISVYNAQGKLLFLQKGNEVDLGAYPPGVYTAVVETKKGPSAQRLVVVR